MAADVHELIVRVAVPSPLRRCFDYRVSESANASPPVPGVRVRVPFRNGTRVGLVMECAADSALERTRLKTVIEVLDAEALLPAESLELLRWSANYYHHPIGEVLSTTLPALLRRGRSTGTVAERRWRLSEEAWSLSPDELARAPRQSVLLSKLRARPEGLTRDELSLQSPHWYRALTRLKRKGWVIEESSTKPLAFRAQDDKLRIPLDTAQLEAVESVASDMERFQAFLLDGVTGSGKTEVYLSLIEDVLSRGQQALVLIPEIGLTPQTVGRFEKRLNVPVSVLHSGLSDAQRLRVWLGARDGSAPVVIGTRSAVFVPLREPGLFVVDEEHDLSYKQQDGFRYSARDLAVIRGRIANVPVLLGTATPSLESLHNVELGRYKHLRLPHRAGGASAPDVSVLDVRGRVFECGLSDGLLQAIEATLAERGQTLLFLNRRGYAPVLMCHQCGWTADCTRCDAHMVYHLRAGLLRCHHCGADRPGAECCPQCGASDLRALGVGTQRVVQTLGQRFPQARIERIDRDTTRRKGALEEVLADVHAGRIDIIVGTQMLAKGHHFPNVTLVSILDADGGLFGADFRASERMAQLLVQVSGRAGRSERHGRVLIQTHHPDHPLLRVLLSQGYGKFAEAALHERRAAGLAPLASLALLRAEAASRDPGFEFLGSARDAAQALLEENTVVLGPVPAPMERRAGRYRAHLLVECTHRPVLHRFLAKWVPELETIKAGRRVRWSLDVDPQDML